MFNFDIPGYGLGTIISFLSMILKSNADVSITSSKENIDLFNNLKIIFNLDFSKIIFIENKEPLPHIPKPNYITDYSKVYSPYITSTSINFKGSSFQLNKPRFRKKPMIGLCCYRVKQDIFYLKDIPYLRSYPYNKIYPLEIYSQIWMKLKELGYDIITLDEQIPLEDKCFIINEYCDAVLGYEGGIMHLAHCLQVPCFILPFRFDTEGKILNPQFPYRVLEKVHLDKRTYFLKSVDEFLCMNFERFEELILDLRIEKSFNNYYLNNNYTAISISKWAGPNEIVDPHLTSLEEIFMSKYFTRLQIGG